MPREARRFSNLRGGAGEAKVNPDSIERVIQRLAASRDGELLLAWLREESMRAVPVGTDEALREANGARVFIARVLGMAQPTN